MCGRRRRVHDLVRQHCRTHKKCKLGWRLAYGRINLARPPANEVPPPLTPVRRAFVLHLWRRTVCPASRCRHFRAQASQPRRPPIRLAYGQRFDSNALLAEAGAPKRSSNGGSAGLIRAAQALATFFTPVAFEAEVRDGARMKRAWTDHGLEDGCGSPCADASGAVADVTTCGAEERHNLPARTVATP